MRLSPSRFSLRKLFLPVTVALGVSVHLAWASPVGLLRIHPQKGALSIQSAAVLSLSGKTLTYAICLDPTSNLGMDCLNSPLKVMIPYYDFDLSVVQTLGLERYAYLRKYIADGNRNIQAYRRNLQGAAAVLQQTPGVAARVEAELEQAGLLLEEARTELQQIRASHRSFPAYNQVRLALKDGLALSTATTVLYNSLQPKIYGANIFPFKNFHHENVCQCVYQFDSLSGEARCRLSKKDTLLAHKHVSSSNECSTREDCGMGQWFSAEGPATGLEVGLERVIKEKCDDYFEAFPTLRVKPTAPNLVVTNPKDPVRLSPIPIPIPIPKPSETDPAVQPVPRFLLANVSATQLKGLKSKRLVPEDEGLLSTHRFFLPQFQSHVRQLISQARKNGWAVRKTGGRTYLRASSSVSDGEKRRVAEMQAQIQKFEKSIDINVQEIRDLVAKIGDQPVWSLKLETPMGEGVEIQALLPPKVSPNRSKEARKREFKRNVVREILTEQLEVAVENGWSLGLSPEGYVYINLPHITHLDLESQRKLRDQRSNMERGLNLYLYLILAFDQNLDLDI